jgi:hypothetical protein
MEPTTNVDLFDLHLDQQSLNYLGETARWARFLSIIGFIFCGIMVLGGVFFGSFIAAALSNVEGGSAFGAMGGTFFGVIYTSIGLLLFFPAFYLYNFSAKMRRAARSNDQQVLTDSLKNLKSFFKFYGIFTIVVLSFYLLLFIAVLVGAMAGHKG